MPDPRGSVQQHLQHGEQPSGSSIVVRCQPEARARPPDSAEEWKSLVAPSAVALETALMSVKDWGDCPVCCRPYPDGFKGHLVGKKHYCNLMKSKWANGNHDPVDSVQWWTLPSGLCIGFDHCAGVKVESSDLPPRDVLPIAHALTTNGAVDCKVGSSDLPPKDKLPIT